MAEKAEKKTDKLGAARKAVEACADDLGPERAAKILTELDTAADLQASED